ncbi:glycosyltransferase [Paludibaculum fermentans]|uniref:Glycosyltransferase n=2 Tax=Paludibaculum fermentans TaxID=1473598 RepID=A0A7S7SPF4_PALFE|nr:glycosyltransferase [Paludibaculum fermentans]
MANEGHNASRFVTAVLEHCAGFRSAAFFAVLDRATTDNTRQILETLAASEPRLRVVWAPENRCVVDAYVRGYREALQSGADWILEIDAGFSHQPSDIPRFFETMAQGYECVFGSRFMPSGRMTDGSLKRYVISRGGTVLSNLLLGTRLSDMTSGFELFSRQALESLLERGIQSRAHFFQTEIKTYCRNLRIAEVPIHYHAPSPRLGSSALKDSFRQLWRLFRLRLKGEL